MLSDCFACTKGLFCNTLATVTPGSNKCEAGFYCPAGQIEGSPAAFSCPAGHYCVAGSKIAKKCQEGTYQSIKQQSSCDICPTGSYCDGRNPSTHVACRTGYYCPSGTKYSSQYPCPEGTYLDITGQDQSSDCKACPVGFFCNQKGQTTYSKQIPAGYFSLNTGESVPNPSNYGVTKGTCLKGHYCKEGTTAPVGCPAGTYNNARGATSLNDCLNCPPGEFCNAVGKTYQQLVNEGGPIHGICTQGFV